MGIYDRDYLYEEKSRTEIKIEYKQLVVEVERQRKLLEDIFDLIKRLREERRELLKRLELLEEEKNILKMELERLKEFLNAGDVE